MLAIEVLQAEASRLTLAERASFASFLLRTLPPVDYTVSDEELARRSDELASGSVVGLSTDEMFREAERLATE